MKNEQEIVRSVFDAYIRDAKATSTKKDRPTFDMLEKVKNRAIKALEQDNEEIFKQFKKKVFLESEDVLGNEMVDSYMITDYLAELMGVEND